MPHKLRHAEDGLTLTQTANLSQNMRKGINKSIVGEGRIYTYSPDLAKEIGFNAAAILDQLHFLLRDERNGKVIDGKQWLYNTYDQWVAHFPWMSAMTLRRLLSKLEADGVLESCQPEGRRSRRKYYRLLIGGTERPVSSD